MAHNQFPSGVNWMQPPMRKNLERALAARRESRRVEFKETFDPGSDRDWCEVTKDIVAIANSGGGVILFGVNNAGQPAGGELSSLYSPDPGQIADRISRYTGAKFADFEIVDAMKESRPVVALVVGEASTLLVFSRSGRHDRGDGRETCAFAQGSLYFRHGAKSEPATTEDVAAAIDRRVKATRRSWLNAVKKVVQSPGSTPPPALSQEVRDSDSPNATPIRVVDDPVAPAYRLVDYDKTHPYRQKELLAAFRQRVPGREVNQFDLLVVRHIYQVDASREFSHRSMFGTRQYSEKFLGWLVENAERDPLFFQAARAQYRQGQLVTRAGGP